MASVVEERPLGRSGRTTSSVALGTAALAVPYGPPAGERKPPGRRSAVRTIEAALARGITLVDTAPGYGDAEAIVGQALKGLQCSISTKVPPPDGGWEALSAAELRRHVRASAEGSLRRLGRDRVAVLQAHNATREALTGPLPEALAAVRDAGLAEMIGATVYEPSEARAVILADELELVQFPYSALDRRPEEQLSEAAAAGTAVVARSILLRGVLTAAGRDLNGPFRPLREAADAFRRSAGATWEALPGAALAFVLEDRRVTSVLLGPRDADELTTILDGAERCARGEPWVYPALPDELLDPRRWTEVAAHG
jgi:1-deoxyxylulose-5-phosphate synthase